MQNNKVEQFANEAVFVLQHNTRDAVRYVQHNTGVARAEAEQAIRAVVTFHKQPKECVAA